MAAEKGHAEVVRLLCEHGVDVSATDRRGRTALLVAVINNHPDGPSLVTNAVFDYESKTEYSIRVKATSSNGGYEYEKNLEINRLKRQIIDFNQNAQKTLYFVQICLFYKPVACSYLMTYSAINN